MCVHVCVRPTVQAPEVCRHEPYNESVDTYSFAVVMYEVLSRTMLIFTHVGQGRVAEDAGKARYTHTYMLQAMPDAAKLWQAWQRAQSRKHVCCVRLQTGMPKPRPMVTGLSRPPTWTPMPGS